MNALFDPLNESFSVDDESYDTPAPLTPTPSLPNRWPPQLVFDLALGLDGYEELEARYALNKHQLDRLFELPTFRQEVALLTRELRDSNEIFKNKAKVQAEAYLDDMHELMKDRNTPASTKLSIFQTLTKLGSLEPKEEPATPAAMFQPAAGQAMRMVVEWIGGPKDHSPIAAKNKTIELVK